MNFAAVSISNCRGSGVPFGGLAMGCESSSSFSEDAADDPASALRKASYDGDAPTVKALLEDHGPSLLSSKDAGGNTALHYAALAGRVEVARHLVHYGQGKVDVHALNGQGKTAREIASAELQALFDNGAALPTVVVGGRGAPVRSPEALGSPPLGVRFTHTRH